MKSDANSLIQTLSKNQINIYVIFISIVKGLRLNYAQILQLNIIISGQKPKTMSQKNYQPPSGYLSQRFMNSKMRANTPTVTVNNLQTSFEKQQKDNKDIKNDGDPLHLIHKQNSILKEQNRVLRRQLNFYRAEGILQTHQTKESKGQVNDLRETIKKQTGEIKDLKSRLQMLSKQCKMYEDIIEKMEGKINKLLEQNDLLQQELKQAKTASDKFYHENLDGDKNSKIIHSEKIKLDIFIEKTNEIVKKYFELQRQVGNDEEEWERWKEQWNKQKTYYLHRIQDLEEMMGIGSGEKDTSKNKKRF